MPGHISPVVGRLTGALSYFRIWISLLFGLMFALAAYWFVGQPIFRWPSIALILLSGAIGALFEYHARASGNVAEDSKSPTPGKTFGVVLLILATSVALSTAIGWFNSVDVRGWWPVGMAVHLFLACVYGLIFVVIAHLRRPFSSLFVIGYNLALGLVLVVFSLLFYTRLGTTSWLFARTGDLALSLFLNKLIHGKAAFLSIFGLFLSVAAILALVRPPQRG